MGIVAKIANALKGRKVPTMPFTAEVTGNAQVEKTMTGYTVSYPIRVLDANRTVVGNDVLVVPMAAGLEASKVSDTALSGGQAQLAALLKGWEEKISVGVAADAVASQIPLPTN